VAYSQGPLRFPKKRARVWPHRFDDPLRRYRTLYCASERLTCFYEVLADLRPDLTIKAKRAAIQLRLPFADPLAEKERAGGVVSMGWRRKHVLVSARIHTFRGELVDLRSVPVRERIAHDHPDFLERHGIRRLDLDVIQAGRRELTQPLGRYLYDQGAAGILYPSKLDGLCAALFERRAKLVAAGKPERLANPIPELEQACRDLVLLLEA
jgi:hypothetical protein